MVAVDTAIPALLNSDPRENVIELNTKMVEYYNFTDMGGIPEWVEEGYGFFTLHHNVTYLWAV